MKLGDGSKVQKHATPPCPERDRLSSQSDRLLAEWLGLRDEAMQTSKNDRSYSLRIKQMHEAEGRLKQAQMNFYQHVFKDHGCW